MIKAMRQAVTWLCFGAIACAAILPVGTKAQSNNNYYQQQQQQQQWQRQQDQQRQQMQTQQRQQMQDQMRQQQQQQMQAQQRQQMQQQQQTQQRQQLQTQQQNQQRQTQQQQQQAQQKQQQLTAQQQAKLGTMQGGKPTGVVIAGGMARMNRPLTPGEIQRGFTGKVTPDGKALIKFQNRVFTVPASRVSGLSAKLAANQNQQKSAKWTAQQRASVDQRIRSITAPGGIGGNGGGSAGLPRAANDNNMLANRLAFAKFYRQTEKPDSIDDHVRGWNYAKPVNTTTLKAGTEICQWQVPGKSIGSYFAPCGSKPDNLGIAAMGNSAKGDGVVPKIENRYILASDVEILKGVAGSTVDDWSIKGQKVDTNGGGVQYLVKTKDLEHFKSANEGAK